MENTLKNQKHLKKEGSEIILLGEKSFVDDGRDIKERVSHTEKNPIEIGGSHGESKKRLREV